MKRLSMIMAVLLLVSVVYVPSNALDLANKLAVGVDGGIMLPVSGNITADSTISDFFKVGPAFGAHVKYAPIDAVTIRTGFDYAFMKQEDGADVGSAGNGYWTMPYVYLDGVLNLGTFFNSESNMFNPYVSAGGGLYFWKITDDGAGGDALVLGNGEDLSKTSVGLKFGGGFEYFATPQISIFTEANYHFVFTSDDTAFGTDLPNWDDDGFLDVKAGLSYWFPIGGGTQ